jgi:recombination protein RecT
MSNEPTVAAEKAVKPLEAFKQALVKMEPHYAVALPSHIRPERFANAVITAVNLNPDLLAADRKSLFNASMEAAQDGLLPDGREGAMVVFGKEVTFLPMVFGVLKKLRNSGEIASVVAHEVYDNDEFSYVLGDDERIEHTPTLDGRRGAVRAAYAIARLKDGTIQREVCLREDIERARSVSRAKNGPAWSNFYGEMARKTVIHRIAKYLPMTAELSEFMGKMARNLDGAGAVIDTTHSEVKSLSAPAGKLEAFESGEADKPKRGRPAKAETESATQATMTDPAPVDDDGDPGPMPESLQR